MLLMVLLLPLNLLGRISNTGRKIALTNIILLNLLALNKFKSNSRLPSFTQNQKFPLAHSSLLLGIVIEIREQGWVIPFEV